MEEIQTQEKGGRTRMKKQFLALLCVLTLMLAACTASAGKPESPGDKTAGEQGAAEQVAIYVPDAQAEHLTGTYVDVPAGSSLPERLVAGLIAAGALPEDVKLLDCSFDAAAGSFKLNLNEAYLNALEASGSAGETMLLYAVVNTFLFNYPTASSLVLTVEGNAIETEHGLYSEPFTEMAYLRE